jgi:hypothetical protein
MECVWPVIVGRDLDIAFNSVAYILDKLISRPPIALSNAVGQDQFRICVDCCPKPKVPALFLWRNHPASVAPDILPLFIKLDSQARKIAKVCVHVIGQRFACLADDSRDGVCSRPEHASNRLDWRSFTERRQN